MTTTSNVVRHHTHETVWCEIAICTDVSVRKHEQNERFFRTHRLSMRILFFALWFFVLHLTINFISFSDSLIYSIYLVKISIERVNDVTQPTLFHRLCSQQKSRARRMCDCGSLVQQSHCVRRNFEGIDSIETN